MHDGGETTCNQKKLNFGAKNSFNIASEASYVYILSGQKFFENAKNGLISGQTVLPDMSIFQGQKFAENDKILNLTYLCGLTPVKLKILIIDGRNGRRRLLNFNLGLAGLFRILV